MVGAIQPEAACGYPQHPGIVRRVAPELLRRCAPELQQARLIDLVCGTSNSQGSESHA
jgi:hypothetical protein